MTPLTPYLRQFQNLSTDRSQWDESTKFRAPHKPLLLLAILDLIAEGTISSNFIELTLELGELFNLYWVKVLPMGRRRGNIALPFWFLKSDKFWHLVSRPGYETFLKTVSRIDTVSKLQETILGAKLDEELFGLLTIGESRELLRAVLIESYFAPHLQAPLQEQGDINIHAFAYSQELLQQAKTSKQSEEIAIENKPYRDQGFRRAIVKAYNHRCAICGVRILTTDGHTAVAAAHIIPWSQSHNDNPRNGLALCPLCHWTFDEGLITFNDRYQVKNSRQLTTTPNLPSHLLTYAGRTLLGPDDHDLWPFIASIQWHRQNIYRRP